MQQQQQHQHQTTTTTTNTNKMKTNSYSRRIYVLCLHVCELCCGVHDGAVCCPFINRFFDAATALKQITSSAGWKRCSTECILSFSCSTPYPPVEVVPMLFDLHFVQIFVMPLFELV